MSRRQRSAISSLFGAAFTPDDHDARMNALLWRARRRRPRGRSPHVSPGNRGRLHGAAGAAAGQSDPAAIGLSIPAGADARSGLCLQPRPLLPQDRPARRGQQLLATRPPFDRPPLEPRGHGRPSCWRSAKGAAARHRGAHRQHGRRPVRAGHRHLRAELQAARRLHLADVAGRHQGAVGAGRRHAGRAAVLPLRRRRAGPRRPARRASTGPGARSARAGNTAEANRYFEMAAALSRVLLRPARARAAGPAAAAFQQVALAPPNPQRSAPRSTRSPLTAAVRARSRAGPTGGPQRYFFREIADQAREPRRSHAGRRLAASSAGATWR